MKNKLIKVAVIQAVDYERCKEIEDKLRLEQFDFVMVCGGIGQCLNILEAGKALYGIVSVDDDTYIVEVLKDKGAYIAGSMHLIDEGICISGIDAKNPIQNIERIKEKLLHRCSLAIILSYYSLKKSSCSRIKLLGKELSIGIKSIFENEHRQSKLLLIACNRNYQSDLCIDRLDSSTTLVSTNKQFISLLIDVQDLSITVLGEQ